jgi:hypothetical protein
MKHQTITVLLLLSSFTALFAQQEIFLDNTPKEKIKLNNIRGVDFSTSIMSDEYYPFDPFHVDIHYQFNYFQELRLFSSFGVVLKGGMKMNRRFITKGDIGDTGDSGTQLLQNSLINSTYGEAHIVVEPRWYFSYFYRYKAGNATLNSGWFIGIPVELNSNLTSYVSFSTNPTLGFRQAITKSLFIEGGIGVVPIFGTFWSSLAPNANLKLAYCL